MRTLSSLAGISVLVVLAGCAAPTVSFNPDIAPSTEGLPVATKHGIHAGVYYSPQFSGYKASSRHGTAVINASTLGRASMQYFDALYARLFAKTTRLDEVSPAEISAKGVDLVIAPSIEHFDVASGMSPYTKQYGIAYRTTLYDRRGVPVASWVVFGTRDHRKQGWISFGPLIESYIADAGSKFIESFEREAGPVLAAIARGSEGGGRSIDAQDVVLTAGIVQPAYFDGEQALRLERARIVPVKVAVSSHAGRSFLIRASDMRLRSSDGQVVFPTNFTSVLQEVQSGPGSGAMVGGMLLGPIGVGAGVMAAAAASEDEREALNKGAGRALFGDRTLGKGSAENGMVFFRLPASVKSREGLRLVYWVVDPGAADGIEAQVPVTDRRAPASDAQSPSSSEAQPARVAQ